MGHRGHGAGGLRLGLAGSGGPQDLALCAHAAARPRGRQGSNKFAFVLGAAVGLAAILVHSVVDFNMHIPANAILAVTLMALLSSCLRFATERYWVTAKSLGKSACQRWPGWPARFTSGNKAGAMRPNTSGCERAARAPSFSPAQVACLQKAFAAEPMNAETACAIGEALRIQSSEGGDNYRELAEQAMEWFDRSIKLNPWGGYSC